VFAFACTNQASSHGRVTPWAGVDYSLGAGDLQHVLDGRPVVREGGGLQEGGIGDRAVGLTDGWLAVRLTG